MQEPGSLVVRKQLEASCEEAFDAWLEPSSLAEFMAPGANAQRVDAEVDARVGGKFRIDMVGKSETVTHTGQYLIIERPTRLSFTWVSKYTENRPSVVTIEFNPRGKARCEIVLTHTGLPDTQVPGHKRTWAAIIDSLGGIRGGERTQ
jgi:uncharacterized protein YndB with AHSA1/START domain